MRLNNLEILTKTSSDAIFRKNYSLIILIMLLVFSCVGNQQESRENETAESKLDSIATDYVKLVLHIGLYNADYVDAYYGPEEWKPQAPVSDDELPFPEDQMYAEVYKLQSQLSEINNRQLSDKFKGRYNSLQKQLIAVKTAIDLLAGKEYSFDEESKLLYDAVAPTYPETHFQALLEELATALPGSGNINERLSRFKSSFIIPKEKLDTVFKVAIAEARNRTLKHIELPSNENFTLEFVTNKSWSGYNWYKGNSYSLIQVNTDLPIYIDRAIDLACHEGYPGHHVFNVLMEKNLVRENGWVEFSVYPLFSPQSLIAEGSANYGIDVAFPGDERIQYESDILFPLAGFNKERSKEYYHVMNLTKGLSYAGNEAARQYLDGNISKEKAIEWLVNYALMTPDRAAQRINFIEQYRSYVINYNLGQDIVSRYIENNGGTAEDPQKRWDLFEELLSFPFTPGQLVELGK